MIVCTLVPLMPNDEMPARRARSVSGQAAGSVSRSTSPAVQSTWDVGSVTCSVRGSSSWRSAMTILMTLAMPAACWVCPMLDLTDPSHSGRSRSCP